MAFAHAWPRVLATHALHGAPVACFACDAHLALVSTGGVEVWSGARDRVRLAAEPAAPGEAIVSALWCGERRALAMLVSEMREDEE